MVKTFINRNHASVSFHQYRWSKLTSSQKNQKIISNTDTGFPLQQHGQ